MATLPILVVVLSSLATLISSIFIPPPITTKPPPSHHHPPGPDLPPGPPGVKCYMADNKRGIVSRTLQAPFLTPISGGMCDNHNKVCKGITNENTVRCGSTFNSTCEATCVKFAPDPKNNMEVEQCCDMTNGKIHLIYAVTQSGSILTVLAARRY